jgi:hypothetical protein
MKRIMRHFDTGSIAVITITLILFSVALFLKGLTHDMLLEAGVFMVSTKLILITYKNGKLGESLHLKLNEMNDTLRRIEKQYSEEAEKISRMRGTSAHDQLP